MKSKNVVVHGSEQKWHVVDSTMECDAAVTTNHESIYGHCSVTKGP